MRSWGLVFKPRGGIAGTGFGAAVVASVVSVAHLLDQSCFPAEKPASALLAAQALPLCRCGNEAPGSGVRRARPLFPFSHRRKTR